MPQQDSNKLYDFPPDDNQDQDQRLPVEPRQPLKFTVYPKQSTFTPAPSSDDTSQNVSPYPGTANQPTVEQSKYNLVPVDYDPFKSDQQSMTHQPSTIKSLSQVYDESSPLGKAAIFGAAAPFLLGKNLIYEPIKAAKDLTEQALAGKDVTQDPANIPKALLAAGLGGTGGFVGTSEDALASGVGMGFKDLLSKQRELEGMRPAIRDPDTRKIYAGKIDENLDHSDIINNIADPEVKQKFMDDLNSENPDFKKFGFLDNKGKFVSRDTLDQQYGVSDSGQLKSKLAMFRSDTAEASQAEQSLAKITNPYTTDAYHGTVGFRGDKIKKDISYGSNRAEFYTTPDIDLAHGFTGQQLKGTYTPGSQILPLKLDTSNYHVYDAKGQYWDNVNHKAIQEALEAGKKGVTIKNVTEEYGDNQIRKGATVHISFDPGTVRSRFAQFDPNKFGQSGLLKSDTSEASQAEQALSKVTPTFYSAVENAVNNIKQAKAPAEQWLSTIQNSKGVKPEEMDWTGLKDYLNENKGNMLTKQEIQDYVKANKVELKEVNKGFTSFDKQRLTELDNKLMQNGKLEGDEIAEYEHLSNAENLPRTSGLETKFSQYQLPGGENYREKLLTLPPKDANTRLKRYGEIQKRMDEIDSRLEIIYNENTIEAGKERIGLENERSLLKREYNLLPHQGEEFKSSHFDEPNILAHVRMNDRNIEGKKSLHLEEIQSDWLQKGRKEGFKQDLEKTPEGKEIRNLGINKPLNRVSVADIAFNKGSVDLQNRWAKSIQNSSNIPDAPFKKTWHELVLKRMIREAAEKGYDRLSWTPGEAQAERYDLSKQVDSIASSKLDNNYHLELYPKGQEGMSHAIDVPENKLANNVGKELADKIIAHHDESKTDYFGRKVWSGLDLKVGGEGMKGFYDQIIPKALEKIGKEYGVKVNQGEINKYTVNKSTTQPGKWVLRDKDNKIVNSFSSKEKAELASKDKVPYIDIPQGLKDQAMQKGFPLFSSGYNFIPVNHNPYDVSNTPIEPIKGSPNPNLSRSEAAKTK